MTNKSENAYKTIGEVAEILELKSKNKGVFSTHTIRFWETQFKQVKPKLLNSNRRYYDQKTIDILKKIKFLLKDQGMTINGVRKILDNSNNNDTLNLDEISNNSIRTNNFKNKVLKMDGIHFKIDSNESISITYEKNSLNFEEIINYLSQNNIKILDIVTEDGDLEDVFIQLTNK